MAPSVSNNNTEDSVSTLAQRVIRQVVLNQSSHTQRSTSSNSLSNINQNNRKVVSFSSVSAPDLYPDSAVENNFSSVEDTESELVFSSGNRPASPPPILTSSPPIRLNSLHVSTVQFETNFVPNTDADAVSALSGEPTFSGDSSIASMSDIRSRSASSISSGIKQVVFSAINPNPHLALRTDGEEDNEYEDQNHVSFTFEPSAENWNDDDRRAQEYFAGGSRGSRSGLSSPSIDLPASPPRSRSDSIGVSISDAAIEVISEAAARLQSHNGDGDSFRNNHKVRFSAIRKETVKNNSNSVATEENNNEESHSHAHVHFAGDVNHSSRSTENYNHEYSYTKEEMKAVADRLRRVIRRAEKLGNLTLEDAFAQFDSDHSGSVSAEELQVNLRRLGSSFDFTLEECSALMVCLTGHDSSEEMNLLSFYGAMGRRSPPLISSVNQSHVTHMDLSESPAVHADNAANRLRAYILTLEQNETDMGVESTFHQLDIDNSGYITADEFQEGLRALGNNDGNFPTLDDEDCDELVQIFDANRDGKVSLIDFYRFMGRRSPPLARSALTDDEVVKKSDEDEDAVDHEHDHFREFLAKKKRDDEDDENDNGCQDRGRSNYASPNIDNSSTGQREQHKSNGSISQSKKAGGSTETSCLMFTSTPPSFGTVEVIIERPAAQAGVLSLLLNEHKEDESREKYAHQSSALVMSRDDANALGLSQSEDFGGGRVGCSAFQKAQAKKVTEIVEEVSIVLDQAMDQIEIDFERSGLSPVPLRRPRDEVRPISNPFLCGIQYNTTPTEVKTIRQSTSEENSIPCPEVELSYNEDHQKISAFENGQKIALSV